MENKLYIDTTNRETRSITLNHKKVAVENDLLETLENELREANIKVGDLTQVEIHTGPGQFTSLRVGLAVSNALNWALFLKPMNKLDIPKYGKEPNITKPASYAGSPSGETVDVSESRLTRP